MAQTDAAPALRHTPLYAMHVRLGARMVPFAGYDMPVQYSSGIIKEHLHTRTAAGLFDVSHMGQIALRPRSGHIADAARALEALLPADILGLAPGRQPQVPRQLAGRMSVPRTYVSKIENEKATPTLSSLERLARALEVGVPDLLTGGERNRQEEVRELMEDQFVSEILPFVAQLNGMQMSSILTQVRDLTVRPRRSA